MRAEPVARSLQVALHEISLFGGSAWDDRKFTRTWVFHEGAFHTDSAVLVLVSTYLPFKRVKTQHLITGNESLVIAEADVVRRVVKEINGMPATEEYARAVGCNVEELTVYIVAAQGAGGGNGWF
jgi:hypothetical protein